MKLAADPRYKTEGTGHTTLGVPSQAAGSALAWDYERPEELEAIFEVGWGEGSSHLHSRTLSLSHHIVVLRWQQTVPVLLVPRRFVFECMRI